MAAGTDTIYCDKTECNLGETIIFSAEPLTNEIGDLTWGRNGINFYEDDVLIEEGFIDIWYGYEYTPSTVGTHTIKIEGYDYITVEITVTGGDSGVSWTIGNKEIKSLTINNKEVKSILRTSDDAILYEKAQEQEVVVKIDTKFVDGKEFCLYDVNNNPLSGKTVHIIEKGGDYDVVTDRIGSCGSFTPISAVFDGDDQYNGCTWSW